MKNKTKQISLGVRIAVASMLVAVPAGAAFAQAAKLEKIEVTGSNIKRSEVEGPLPVQIISREEIDRSAAATIGDFVRALSVNTGGSGAESDVNNQSGAAGISLRGLGQKSTLVLINGRRMANHAFARNLQDTFVDINSIPKGAIERIEVLKDGASAIYGSDAIAGVVNFIMRRDYQGGSVSASSGKAGEGGLGETNFNISGGFGSLSKDKYNVFAVLDVFKRDRLLLNERKWIGDGDMSRFGGGNGFLAFSAGTWRSVAPDRPFVQGQLLTVPAGTPGAVRSAAFTTCIGNGFRMTLTPFAPLHFSTGTACANTVTPYITAFPEASRVAFLSRGTMEFSGTLAGFAELSFASNESKWINQHQTMTTATQTFDPLTQGSRIFSTQIPAANSSNPFGVPMRLRYTFFDVGARELKLKTDAYRLLTGLTGVSGSWDWEVAVGNSESKIKEDTNNQVDANALTAVINSNSYNFQAPTPGQTASIRTATQRNSVSKLSFGDAKATTTVGRLSGGDIGLAVGFDARREAINDTPDILARTGRLLGTGSSITSGSRNVVALYSEMTLPISKVVEFQLAVRGDRYSDFGSAVSPKVGAKWTALDNLLFRASYNRGFRAPTLTENTQSSSLTFASATTGAPGGISVIFTGNPNLKAEKSESTSVGVVWEPTKSISLGTDWYTIVQRNLVSANGVGFVLANQALYAADIVRDSLGNIVTIYDRYSNVAEVRVDGFDIDGRWAIVNGPRGKLTLRGNMSHLLSFRQPLALNAPLTELAGNNLSPRGALPRRKGKLGLDWDYGGFAVTVNGNYNGGYEQKRALTFHPAGVINTIGVQTTTDLSIAYKGFKNLKISASITNLTDKQPEYDGSLTAFDTTQYDLRGRYSRIGIEYKFK